jgi:pimeloyl-ACP methyl ester carboxylesterase
MKRLLMLLGFISCFVLMTNAQSVKPDLQDVTKWTVINRTIEAITENGKQGIRFNEAGNDGALILKGIEFSNGTIEFDVKGKNVLQQSFVGIAFHAVDEKTYDAVYFRPFNFKNDDIARRSRAVQYISMPGYPWEKLREAFPGKYENKVNPVPDPDDWFHVKVVVDGKKISAYLNDASQPCLQVEKLTENSKGGLALWVGNNSGGSFANLSITPSLPATTGSPKQIQYGNNPDAGHYVDVGDAKLYYEIYGKGQPLLMLHGGVYGYISEFEPFIPKLAENFQVICMATRGHGKSEMGTGPVTYKQRADDAYKLVRSITKDSVVVLGFSDGGYSGLKLAALYPQLVKKLIVIGAGDIPKVNTRQKYNYTAASLTKEAPEFFKGRLALMPEPARWNESLSKLNKLYNEDYVSTETFSKIKCPVLVMSGDRDSNHALEDVVRSAKAIKGSRLSIIPGCSHVVFFCNFPAVWEAIYPFLK